MAPRWAEHPLGEWRNCWHGGWAKGREGDAKTGVGREDPRGQAIRLVTSYPRQGCWGSWEPLEGALHPFVVVSRGCRSPDMAHCCLVAHHNCLDLQALLGSCWGAGGLLLQGAVPLVPLGSCQEVRHGRLTHAEEGSPLRCLGDHCALLVLEALLGEVGRTHKVLAGLEVQGIPSRLAHLGRCLGAQEVHPEVHPEVLLVAHQEAHPDIRASQGAVAGSGPVVLLRTVLEVVDLDWGSLDIQARLLGSLEDLMAPGVCNCLEAQEALMELKRDDLCCCCCCCCQSLLLEEEEEQL